MTDHIAMCQSKLMGHSDAARRLSDTFNLHRVADPHGTVGKWFAVRLHDGTGDGVLYDTKVECVRHQHHDEQFYAFVKIVPLTMNVCDAEIYLSVARRAYDAGMRLADPQDKSGGRELIKRSSVEDQLSLARGFVTNVTLGRVN